MRSRRSILALLLLGAVAGCGRRGNLKLPDEKSPDENKDGPENGDEGDNGDG